MPCVDCSETVPLLPVSSSQYSSSQYSSAMVERPCPRARIWQLRTGVKMSGPKLHGGLDSWRDHAHQGSRKHGLGWSNEVPPDTGPAERIIDRADARPAECEWKAAYADLSILK